MDFKLIWRGRDVNLDDNYKKRYRYRRKRNKRFIGNSQIIMEDTSVRSASQDERSLSTLLLEHPICWEKDLDRWVGNSSGYVNWGHFNLVLIYSVDREIEEEVRFC